MAHQIGSDIATAGFGRLQVNADIRLANSIKARPLVMVIETLGKVAGLANIGERERPPFFSKMM